MNQAWTDFLTQQGLGADALDFGDRQAETSAAQLGSIMSPLLDLGLIRASGPEAAGFLHNLLTNDIESLEALPDTVIRAGLCTPKGRMLATFLVWREGDDFLLALAADLHAAILKKLSMYILRSKVKLTDASADFVLLGLSGEKAESTMRNMGVTQSPPMKTCLLDNGNGRLLCLAEQRYLLALPATRAPAVWQTLSSQLRPAGLNAWRWREIMAGLPQIGAATQDEFTPQMVNYELIGGVSFKKGCYPGQEIVARTQYLGKVKRRMMRFHAEGGAPAPGVPLFSPESPDQPCGMVVLAAASPVGGQDLLAVIQMGALDTPSALPRLGQTDGPSLQLQPLPYSVQ